MAAGASAARRRLARGPGRGLLAVGGRAPRPAGALGLEGGDHVGVGRSVEGLGQRAQALAQHAGEAAGPLDHALGPTEGGGQVGLALGRQLVNGALGVGVELG